MFAGGAEKKSIPIPVMLIIAERIATVISCHAIVFTIGILIGNQHLGGLWKEPGINVRIVGAVANQWVEMALAVCGYTILSL